LSSDLGGTKLTFSIKQKTRSRQGDVQFLAK